MTASARRERWVVECPPVRLCSSRTLPPCLATALTKTLGGCLRTDVGRSCATFDSSTRARAAHNSSSQLPRVTRRRYGPPKKIGVLGRERRENEELRRVLWDGRYGACYLRDLHGDAIAHPRVFCGSCSFSRALLSDERDRASSGRDRTTFVSPTT